MRHQHTAFPAVKQLLRRVYRRSEACVSKHPPWSSQDSRLLHNFSSKAHTSKPHHQRQLLWWLFSFLIEHPVRMFLTQHPVLISEYTQCVIVRFYVISYLQKVHQCVPSSSTRFLIGLFQAINFSFLSPVQPSLQTAFIFTDRLNHHQTVSDHLLSSQGQEKDQCAHTYLHRHRLILLCRICHRCPVF